MARKKSKARANAIKHANLRGADLSKADLSGAILCNTQVPSGEIEYSGCIIPLLLESFNTKIQDQ